MALARDGEDVGPANLYSAVARGGLGRLDDARAALDERRRLQPDMRGHPSQHRHPVFNYIGDGLRKAGLDIPDEPTAAD